MKTYINDMLYQHGLRIDMNDLEEPPVNPEEPPVNPEEPPVNPEEQVNSNMFMNSDEDAIV